MVGKKVIRIKDTNLKKLNDLQEELIISTTEKLKKSKEIFDVIMEETLNLLETSIELSL